MCIRFYLSQNVSPPFNNLKIVPIPNPKYIRHATAYTVTASFKSREIARQQKEKVENPAK